MRLQNLFEAILSTDQALQVLKLSRGYSVEDLRKARNKAILANHPDKIGKQGIQRTKDIIDAFKLLSSRVDYTPSDEEMSGEFIHGGRYQTSDDWRKMAQKKADAGDVLHQNMLRHMDRSGEEWETTGERLARLGGEKGIIPSTLMAIALLNLRSDEYKVIKPHLIHIDQSVDVLNRLREGVEKFNFYASDLFHHPTDAKTNAEKNNGIHQAGRYDRETRDRKLAREGVIITMHHEYPGWDKFGMMSNDYKTWDDERRDAADDAPSFTIHFINNDVHQLYTNSSYDEEIAAYLRALK